MWLISLAWAGTLDEAWEAEGLAPPAPGPERLGRDVRFVGWGPDRIAIATSEDPLLVVNLVDDSVLADHPEGIAATLDRHGIDRGDEVDFWIADPAVLQDVAVRVEAGVGLWEVWAVHPEHCGKVVHSSRDRPEPLATFSAKGQPRGAVLLASGEVVGVHLDKGFESGGPAEFGGLAVDLPKGWVERGGELVNTCAYQPNDMSDELAFDRVTSVTRMGGEHRNPAPYSAMIGRWVPVTAEPATVAGFEATRWSWSVPGAEANDSWCREWTFVRAGDVQSIQHCTGVPAQAERSRAAGEARQAEVEGIIGSLRPPE